MNINVTITFDRDEKKILRKQFADQLHKIDQSKEQIKLLNKIIDSSSTADEIVKAAEIIDLVEESIKAEINCQADPEWIRKNQEMQSQGKATIVVNPELAVEYLNKVRQEQLDGIKEAGELLLDAFSMLRCRS